MRLSIAQRSPQDPIEDVQLCGRGSDASGFDVANQIRRKPTLLIQLLLVPGVCDSTLDDFLATLG